MLCLRLSLTAAVLISAAMPAAAAQRSSFSDDPTARGAIVRFLAAVDDYVSSSRNQADLDPETLCLPDENDGIRPAPLVSEDGHREGHLFSADVARTFRRVSAACCAGRSTTASISWRC